MSKHLIESISEGNLLEAEDIVLARLNVIKEQKLVEAKEVIALEMFNLDEAGLAQATKIARELKKHPLQSRAFKLSMKLRRSAGKPQSKAEPKNDDAPKKSHAPEIPPQTRDDGKKRASDVYPRDMPDPRKPEDRPKSRWERKSAEGWDFYHSMQGKEPRDKEGKLKSPTGHIIGKALGSIAASIGE